jgi:RHS repeat-associated protein
MLGTLNGSGQPAYANATWNCVPANITERGDGAWQLFDYNGDGLDDLFVSSFTDQGWRVHPSNGVHFDMTTNLIASLSPAIPSVQAAASQVHLADMNGDGLTDIVYYRAGALRTRIMERQSTSFAWGNERTTSVDEQSMGSMIPGCDDPSNPYIRECEMQIAGTPTAKTNFLQMVDFNGDASSDLLIQVNAQAEEWNYAPGCEMEFYRSGATVAPDGLISNYQDPDEPEYQNRADPCWDRIQTKGLYAMVVKEMTATTVLLTRYSYVANANAAEYSVVLTDINGDGLSDRVVKTSSTDWAYSLNTGRGFTAATVLPLSDYKDHARFVDVTGDGRADMLYLVNYGSYKGYAVRKALPDGTFAAGVAMPGGNARLCQGSGCDQNKHVPIFGDVDGDGNLDFQALSFAGTTVGTVFSRGAQTFQPRDVITNITNGMGATTQLQYAPLTNNAVYRRSSGSRNSLNWGRGAPVQDVLASSYVVARASSSAPRAGDAAAVASLYYRYANARVQAGGRGFLGFGSLETIDPNQSGGHVVTATTYAQNFPYVGLPLQTVKKAVGAAYAPPACLAAVTNACFSGPGSAHPDLGGQWFSSSVQSWEMAGSLASQTPIHVRTQGTEEMLRDPFTGATTSKIITAFTYGSYGNVTQTVADTFTGTGTLTATQITQNTYSDDASKWRLGRLTASTVTHRRPGYADVVRTAGFSYAMSGAGTGMLTEERTQPGGAANLASTTAYALDDYGNRLQSVTCAAPATGCSVSGLVFHPSSVDAIRRYSRVEFDAQGRFPVATFAPFWNGAGGEERRTSYVVSRNVFGDAVEVLDVNGVRNVAIKGGLGRDYYSWSQTAPQASPGSGGISGITTYRWCQGGSGAVACPTGAVFRQQVVATAAPRQWVYFDVLGRPIMKAAETFNAGVNNQDVSAVCTEYDAVGRVSRSSNPFFLSGTADATGPTDVAGVCTSVNRAWAFTQYDILGRPTLVQAPDGSQATSQYAGLTTTTRDARNNPTIQVRNGKGEVVSSQDASGFITQFAYRADGNLVSVTRNAGNGVITNSFSYDVLGRKILQVDPDSGTTTFDYNALGEVIAQTDNGGYRTERELDARGRTWRTTAKLPDGTIESQATTEYDTTTGGSGKVASESITGQYAAWSGQAGTALAYQRDFSYDVMGRPTSNSLVLDEGMFGSEVQYDALGRPWKSRDASGLWSKTEFGSRGATATCASDDADNQPGCTSAVDTYTRTLATDAWGNVVRDIRAGQANLEVRRQYHAVTGRITEICGGNSSCNLVQESYVWDAAGNLDSHQKEGRYLEQFTYDSLNRVTEGRLAMANGAVVNQPMLANAYDQLGNVCSKDGLGYGYPGADGCVGALPMARSGAPHVLAEQAMPTLAQASRAFVRPAWSRTSQRTSEDSTRSSQTAAGLRAPATTARRAYAARSAFAQGVARMPVAQAAVSSIANSPHAVNQVGTGTAATFYYYDDRGNQTLRDAPGTTTDRTIRYTADGRAHEIQMGNGQVTRFWYGPDGQRFKRTDGAITTLYVGGVEILVQNGVQTSARRYAAGVALQTVVNGAAQSTRYLFHDHLGSLVRIANPDGSVAEALDYATFGARRTYGNPSGTGSASNYTPRGYTGHEYVDGAQVTHMNGRIYDEQLARFLQPDPVVQAPSNGQSWNAYTYVFNNPLAYTDPTGQFGILGGLAVGWAMHNYVHKGLIRGAMQAIGPNATGLAVGVGCSFAPGPWGILCAAGGSYDAARAFGASSKEARQAAVAGAFTAAVGYGLGKQYGGRVTFGRVAVSAMAGGIAAEIQGGKFGNGFVAAGLTAAVMPQVGHIQNDFGRTVVGAMIGGTISEATGGKFANGAISGAIQGAMTRNPKQKLAVNVDAEGTGDGTEGAPDYYLERIKDVRKRQGFLNDLAAAEGMAPLEGNIIYVDSYYTKDPGVAAYTDGTTVHVFSRAFEYDYWAIVSILQHEHAHWWLIKNGAYQGVRAPDERQFGDAEHYSLEMKVIDEQMGNPVFKLTSDAFQRGTLGYRAVSQESLMYVCSRGFTDCRGLYGY